MRRMMPRLVLMLLAIALAACAAPAAADAPPVKPGAACETPEQRQLDFWVGDWDVHDAKGKLAGRNRIAAVHGRCAVEEQWAGNGNVTGSSLNAYDGARGRWHQTWVDNLGNVLLLEGTWQDGRMMLRGSAPLEHGAALAMQRMSLQPLPDGRVRQLWEASTDQGATWSVVFEGYYSRRR